MLDCITLARADSDNEALGLDRICAALDGAAVVADRSRRTASPRELASSVSIDRSRPSRGHIDVWPLSNYLAAPH